MTGLRLAYGLGIAGLDDVESLPALDPAAPSPAGTVTVSQTTRPAGHLRPGETRRVLLDGRTVVFRRDVGTARYHGPPLTPDELAHPYLAVTASRFNRWLGRECFHAGVFVAAGRAWLLFGRRTAGKSTLLAALLAHGCDVLADDLAVTDGRVAFAGPRSVDLRDPLPDRHPRARAVRLGTRLRLDLGPVPDRMPIGGMFFLQWADEPVATDRVPPAHLLARLAQARNAPELPTDPLMLLELGGLPAWDLRRPRRWSALPDTVAAIADATAGSTADSTGASRPVPARRPKQPSAPPVPSVVPAPSVPPVPPVVPLGGRP